MLWRQAIGSSCATSRVSVRGSEARTGRNPRTGKQVTVPARTHVQFRPGKAMRARLNLNRAAPEPEAEVRRLLRAS